MSEAQKMPGLCYLALEWLYQVDQPPRVMEPSEEQVNHVLNKIYQLQDRALALREGVDMDLALRRMLLAQLWYQRNPRTHLADICRSFALMDPDKGSSWFDEQFYAQHGVKLKDIFFVATLLTVNFMKGAHKLKYSEVLPKLVPKYEPEYAAKLLRLIGKPLHEVEDMLASAKQEPIRPSEYFKDPVLLDSPAILREVDMTIIHRPLFIRAMGTLVRRLFVAIDKPAFMQRYSIQFERYVQIVLEEASYDFITENDIEVLYATSGRKGQQKVDFVVKESEASIFIDAKGVDPLQQIKNSDTPKFIFDKAKQLQKGVRQAFSAAKNLEEPGDLPKRRREDRFAMVVTNLDFGIPDGTRLGNLDDRFFPNLVAEYGDLFDPKNIFILSVEDLEGICQFCRSGLSTINEFLRSCAERDSDRSTRRHTIRQHLDELSKEKTGKVVSGIGSDYVYGYVDKLMGEAKDAIIEAEAYWKAPSMADLRKVTEYIEVQGRLIAALDLERASR